MFESPDLLPLVASFADEAVLGTLPLVNRAARRSMQRPPVEHACAWALGPLGCWQDQLGEHEERYKRDCRKRLIQDLLVLDDPLWRSQAKYVPDELRFGPSSYRLPTGKQRETFATELESLLPQKQRRDWDQRLEVVWPLGREKLAVMTNEDIGEIHHTWAPSRNMKCEPTLWVDGWRVKYVICYGQLPGWSRS